MGWFDDWAANVADGWNRFWHDGSITYPNGFTITNPWADGSYVGSIGAGTGSGAISPINSINPDVSGANIPQSTTVDGNNGLEAVDTALADALQGSVSIQDYFKNHPDASPEELLDFMARDGNDEWTEKWLDYYLDKQSIAEANAYTASREDTAYQRLVKDLQAAGLNPAMMYGGSASTHAAGSIGAASPSGGANSASISNYSKIKKIILAYMVMQMQLALGMTNSVGKGLTSLLGAL